MKTSPNLDFELCKIYKINLFLGTNISIRPILIGSLAFIKLYHVLQPNLQMFLTILAFADL